MNKRLAALPLECPENWRRDINWSERRRDTFRKCQKEHYRRHGRKYHRYGPEQREQGRVREAKRRAAKLQRMPSWADIKAIDAIYRGCPKGFHVDHIVPLQGEKVSGLHIENNLQYLPAAENIKKRNRWDH